MKKRNLAGLQARVVKQIGWIETSPNIDHVVMIVKDENNRKYISFQPWWQDAEGVYQPGKGFFLSQRRAKDISTLLDVIPSEDIGQDFQYELEISNTQKYIITYNSGHSGVMVAKWWRKDDTLDWAFNKAITIELENLDNTIELLDKAVAHYSLG